MGQMIEIDIDESKCMRKESVLKYSLSNARVFETEYGFHFTDYFDELNDSIPTTKTLILTDAERRYIERNLQSNSNRYSRHVETVQNFVDVTSARCLDVGCGGGLFLSKLKSLGTEVYGIDPNEHRVQYARERYDIDVSTLPIENSYWQNGYRNTFDLITLWDVIEHVNLPFQVLCAAYNLLKCGGYLILDTPCKDSAYYRLGEISYQITLGRWAPLLEVMYKNEPFGHKQIFSTDEMSSMIVAGGYKCVSIKRFHELSFPIAHYFRRLRVRESAAVLLESVIGWIIRLNRIRNKMVVVAKKY
jgi:2-polyprenyl-6-hydroxyphenyl methylase/3-demethylubiquinone-9 3-methyltransferase